MCGTHCAVRDARRNGSSRTRAARRINHRQTIVYMPTRAQHHAMTSAHTCAGCSDQHQYVFRCFQIHGAGALCIRHDSKSGHQEGRRNHDGAAILGTELSLQTVFATDKWRAVRHGAVIARLGSTHQ